MKTTRGRVQGCTKNSSPVVQDFYQPSNNKDQLIIEDRFSIMSYFYRHHYYYKKMSNNSFFYYLFLLFIFIEW